MKNQNSNIVFVAIVSALITFVSTVAFFANKEAKEDDNRERIDPEILISQNQMKENYGWKDVILWNESKESFEKAFKTKLHWMNYPLGFKKDPSCIDPFGGASEWRYDKICYQYVRHANIPDMLEDASNESKGKILVVLGTIYNNGENFFGNAYWCE